jgi:predicted transcriptional regulator
VSEPEQPSDFAALTVQLLSAYLANNTVASDDLAELIRSTRNALAEESSPAPAEAETKVHTPAVSVRKSLSSPDYIISLIDGKPYKTLKRHLSRHGLTPETYRERYNLPASYPMVAPSFAAHRRAIAEKIGLGNRRRTAEGSEGQSEAATQGAAADAVAAPPGADSKVAKAKTGEGSVKRASGRGRKAAPAEPASSSVASANGADGVEEAATSAPQPSQSNKPEAKPASAKPTRGPGRRTKPEEAQASATGGDGKAKTPKRRGKLGLFGQASQPSDAEAKPQTPRTASSAPSSEAQEENGVSAPVKSGRRKRMARDPN